MKEAILYKIMDKKEKKIKCLNCAHYCVLTPGKKGICGVRENQAGKIYSLNYGKIIALYLDPIEKKPFFHFLPGTTSLSFASVGCNFRCLNCLNYDISQEFKKLREIPGKEMKPSQIVAIALKNKTPSISYTYTEPAVFSDFALETMKLAKRKKIKNCWVSNGFWSEELFELISPYLDAANIDLKAFSDDVYLKLCGGRLGPVLETLKKLKKKKIWLEITTLVVPGFSDSEKMFKEIAQFILKELGSETPWHITRFSPEISWKLQNTIETPIETIEKAWRIGKEAGLKYVYTGNIPGIPSEDTFCPNCKKLMIDRFGFQIKRHDKNGKCSYCGYSLNIIE